MSSNSEAPESRKAIKTSEASGISVITRGIFFAFIALGVSACNADAESHPQQKANFSYWSNVPGHTCVRMAEKDYCVKNEQIRAANFITDSAPGFLVQMPVKNPDLRECNRDFWILDKNPTPSIQLSFGDRSAFENGKTFDTTERLYKRIMTNMVDNDEFGNWTNPKSYSKFYGLNCIKYRKNSYLREEMLCHGGQYGSDNPPFFFSCNWGGSVPYPGCSYQIFVDGIEAKASFRKSCAPYHSTIRSAMIAYIRSLQIKGK